MKFKKGHVPWNKGIFGYTTSRKGQHHTKDTKKIMSKIRKEYLKTHPNPTTGLKRPDLVIRNKSNKNKNFEEIYGSIKAKKIKKKIGITQSGKKSHFWLGGKSFEPYSYKFNRALKSKIKKKYKDVCQICLKKKKKLHIHHIDYDKLNNSENNLAPLCPSCHSATNFNREIWKEHFRRNINGNKRHAKNRKSFREKNN